MTEADVAAIRTTHQRMRFCCWCDPGEPCPLITLCDALDAAPAAPAPAEQTCRMELAAHAETYRLLQETALRLAAATEVPMDMLKRNYE